MKRSAQVILGVAFASLTLFGGWRPAPPPAVVEAQRFVVKNPDGTIAAEFGMLSEAPGKAQPGLRFFDQGKPVADLVVHPKSGVLFTIRDLRENERISLGAISSNLGGADSDEARFSVYDRNGRIFAELSSHDNTGGSFSLSDAHGQGRIELHVPAKDTPPLSVPVLRFFDAKGSTILDVPPIQKRP